jgi:hypothetical protein
MFSEEQTEQNVFSAWYLYSPGTESGGTAGHVSRWTVSWDSTRGSDIKPDLRLVRNVYPDAKLRRESRNMAYIGSDRVKCMVSFFIRLLFLSVKKVVFSREIKLKLKLK